MTMSEPSTPLLFEETELPSMSSSEAGLARTSALRARELAWTANAADYGAKSPVWLANFDPSSSSWKTAQLCLASTGALTLAAYSGTWPRSGTMRNGTASALPDLTHPTSVIASGLWRTGEELFPTPTTKDNMISPSMAKWPKNRALIEKLYPTLHGMADASNPRRAGPSGNELGREVNKRQRMLPTPVATDATHGGRVTPRKARNGGNLIEAVSMMLYPTPTARDWKSGKTGPAIMDHRGNPKNSRPLNEVVLLPTPTASRRSGLQSHGENAILGSLNPDWCEWLQGLPIGWSALRPSGTATPRSSPKP